MAISHLTKKELMKLIESQTKTINEQKERIELLEHFDTQPNSISDEKESMMLMLELTPNYCPVDEFMLAGAIYRYCSGPASNLDVDLVADMIFNKSASERKRKFSEDDEDE